ncbi:MAG TPA: xanthine dehydrogenase family protein subunit M, partial [Burkholderiales bacterium]|nr:xanthine dehydrogenase family protein subunit M [Burkholderiales bacterium]
MIPFELVEPTSLSEAIALLDPGDPAVRPIAGGTAVLLMMKAGVFRPRRLVSLRAIEPRMTGIATGPGGELRVGAMTPLAVVERAPAVRRGWPVIARTLRTLANVRVRNVATVGGHLAHADPHMDLPPVLSALGAEVIIAGPAGERAVPIEALSTGYYETVLRRDELITTLTVPPLGRRRAAYLKCTTRSADDWPALGVAVVLEEEGGAIRSARLVVGAATDKPARLAAAEAVLRGATADDATLRRAGDAAADELDIVGDARGSASYKKQ